MGIPPTYVHDALGRGSDRNRRGALGGSSSSGRHRWQRRRICPVEADTKPVSDSTTGGIVKSSDQVNSLLGRQAMVPLDMTSGSHVKTDQCWRLDEMSRAEFSPSPRCLSSTEIPGVEAMTRTGNRSPSLIDRGRRDRFTLDDSGTTTPGSFWLLGSSFVNF